MMIWLAVVFLLMAVAAAVPVTPNRIPAFFLGFYWLPSFLAQSFAFPLCVISTVLALLESGDARWVFGAASAVYGFVHWRNRSAGNRMLAATGLAQLRIPLLAGLAPFLTGQGRTRRIKDLTYGDAGERNRLDLVAPRKLPPTPMPILIHIPGGAWVIGAKNQQAKPLLHHLAGRGWLCVDINYRLGPTHRGPAWVIDVLKAVAWVRANAAEHGGDPARIVLTGGSAGGHLAALAALAHDDPAFKPGFEHADCSVSAAVALYGRYDFLDRHNRLGRNHEAVIMNFMASKVMPGPPTDCPDLWRAVSPLDRLRADAPPMLVVHGSGDTMLPYQDARDFAEALGRVSLAPVTYFELPGIQHAWDTANSPLSWAHVRAVEAFLAPLVHVG